MTLSTLERILASTRSESTMSTDEMVTVCSLIAPGDLTKSAEQSVIDKRINGSGTSAEDRLDWHNSRTNPLPAILLYPSVMR